MAAEKIDRFFGDFIRTKRNQLEITQERIAELIGISTVQYRNIEKGKTRSNWITIVKICLVLRIDITYFAEIYIKPEINEVGKFLGVEV